MYQIPLKAKYRVEPNKKLKRDGIDPPEGTLVYPGGRFKSKSSNSGDNAKAKQGTGHRMKSYWGNVRRRE